MNFFYFFLINKNNLNNYLFYNLDACIYKSNYIFAVQTFFDDIQLLISIKFSSSILSLTKIYNGNLWLEREIKEFNKINITNLLDSRKLLSNYNYNEDISYNQFNLIVNDIKI